MGSRSAVGLADVAAKAGVSKATASKAFSGREEVAPKTRERVLAVAAELGYLPPVRTPPEFGPQVWVALTSLVNPYFGLLLEGLLAEAQPLGASVVTCTWSPSADYPPPAPASPGWIRQGLERGAQAFILVTTPVTTGHLRVARAAGAPLMVIDPLSAAPTGVLSISATNWRGGVQATEYLIGLGHQCIAFVGAPPESNPGIERQAGYRSALERAGLRYDPRLVLPGRYGFEDGLMMRPLLESEGRPTAVFAANDLVACGVLEAARQVGVVVPEQLSIVGFDDTLLASVAAPPLTTVRQPLMEMGSLAVRTCVAALRGTPTLAPHVQLATTLVVRSSTAPAPRA